METIGNDFRCGRLEAWSVLLETRMHPRTGLLERRLSCPRLGFRDVLVSETPSKSAGIVIQYSPRARTVQIDSNDWVYVGVGAPVTQPRYTGAVDM